MGKINKYINIYKFNEKEDLLNLIIDYISQKY